MATKPSITTIAEGSKYSSAVLNANFTSLQDAFEDVWGLLGTGEGTNTVTGILDMNLNRVKNLGAPTADADAVRLQDLQDAATIDSGLVTLRAELGSTTDPSGASLIGLWDTAGIYTADDVEAALAEIGVGFNAHDADTEAHGASGANVGTTNVQTLTNKTLTTPTIGDLTNMTHNHATAAGGGVLSGDVSGLSGLIMSNFAGDTTNDITVSIGGAADSTESQWLILGSAFTKQINAAWAPGSLAGGFPTGASLTNDTWYYVFLISTAAGTTDIGFDSSATAVNLLADATGYTLYRRVGYIRYGTATIVQFFQYDNEIIWDVPIIDESLTDCTIAATTTILTVPPSVVAKFQHTVQDDGGNAKTMYGMLTNTDQTATAPSLTIHNLKMQEATNGRVVISTNWSLPVASDSSVRTEWDSVDGTPAEYEIVTLGYIDYR